MAALAVIPLGNRCAANGHQLRSCRRAVLIGVETVEQARKLRLQFGERDAVVAIAVDGERARQRIAIPQPFERPVAIVDIADRALMRAVERLTTRTAL